MIIYLAKRYLLQKSNEPLLVVTEKTGHAVNAEKPTHVFKPCKENAVEVHNVTVNNKYLKFNKFNFCVLNTDKSNLQSQVN